MINTDRENIRLAAAAPAVGRLARRALPGLLFIVVAACNDEPPAAPRVPAPPLVDTAMVAALSEASLVKVTGTVRARRETTLAFATAGRVDAISVDEGDVVRAGQQIAHLNPDRVEASNAVARAEADRAAADLARQQTLFASGWIARARLEAAEAAARVARAQVSSSAFDVGAARVVAPVDGVVLRRHVERNQIVAAGAPIVTMAEAAGGYVIRVPLGDRDLARIALGNAAVIRIPALSIEPLNGQVIEIGGRGDERTGTFEVEISLSDASRLRSGLIGNVEIAANGMVGSLGVVSVPPMAVFGARADEGFVYVIQDGRARVRLIKLGRVGDQQVQVLSGLRPGDRVAVSGIERLREDMAVREVPQ